MLFTSEVPFLPVMRTTGENGGAATDAISQIHYVPARLAWRTARGLLRDENHSRCYLLRDSYLRGDGMLKQLTTDHTMIEGLIQSGKTREEAEASGWGNVVLEAVGVLASVSPRL